jgi:glycerophosphoryl diester phosphodiesterase
MVTVFAHRGASARERENTLAAFIEARRLGAGGVELDVRRSRDGALVVYHDAVLPGMGAVCDLAVADLPAEVPLLAEVLEVCPDVIVNVELKDLPGEPGYDPSGPLAGMVVAALRSRPAGSALVSSFDLVGLDGVHHLDPDLVTGWLTPPGFDQHAALDTAGGRGHRALHPHHQAVTASLVDRAHEVGLAVNTWTVDDPGRIRELAAMGVDGIITNVPDVALAALEPPWPPVRERRA